MTSLLDVGCNVGAWLKDCSRLYPSARLCGIEINEPALAVARRDVPSADLRHAGAECIPFEDQGFDFVTCIEVLEHLPEGLRPEAFREMRRVLRSGGRLILTVPHAGWFAWADSNNMRMRFPKLYRRAVKKGLRDGSYEVKGRDVEWHRHFRLDELMQIAGGGWKAVGVRRGGLFLYPLMDWMSWPFYRIGAPHHPIRRLFERVAGWDYAIDFGRASYGVLIVLERDD